MKLIDYNHDYINAVRDLSNTRPSKKFRKKLLDAMSLNWTGAVLLTNGQNATLSYTAPYNGEFLEAYLYKYAKQNNGTVNLMNGYNWFKYGWGDSAYAGGGISAPMNKGDVMSYSLDGSGTPIARIEYFIPTKGVTND